MRRIRCLFSAVVLLAVLSSAAVAGDMQTPGYAGPLPPPPASSNTAAVALDTPAETNPVAENLEDIVTDLMIDALLSIF
jgi:hypothetical protein